MNEWRETEIGILPKDWNTTKLALIAKANKGLVDGPFGSNLPASEYTDSGVPVIRGVNLSLGEERFFDDGFVFVSENFAKNLKRSICVPGDIIFTKKGTIGQIGIIPYNSRYKEYLLSSNQMKLSVDEEKVDLNFVYYYLSSSRSIKRIRKDSEYTGVPKINLTYLKGVVIPLPNLDEQKEIGRILFSIDQKITLLQSQNQILEKIAQTLFKHWFIDFEFPNAEGKPYRSSGGKMVGSEFGEVPKDWKVNDVYELIEVDYGFPFKSQFFNETRDGLPLIRIRDLKKGDGSFYTTEEFDQRYIIQPGDVLAGMDAEFKPYLWSGTKALLNQRVCRFRPKNNNISKLFLYELVKPHLHFYEKTKAGTTVIHLGKSDIDQFEIIQPKEKILLKYKQITDPLLRKYINNNKEIRTLTKTRDTLLPKLMSGQIRISDATKAEL